MARTAAEAKSLLANVESVEDLRKLILEIDASSTGNPTVLFSGRASSGSSYGAAAQALGDQHGARIIQESEVAKFLDFESNSLLVSKLEELVGGDPSEADSSAYRFLNGDVVDGKRVPNGIWDDVSARFARETAGEVVTLIEFGKLDGTFALAELPALLENPNVTTIDGLPREQLRDLYRTTDLPTVLNAVALNSQVRISLSGLASGDLSGFLDLGDDDLAKALEDPAKREAVQALLDDADPRTRAAVQSGLDSLLAGAEVSRLNGATHVLNRMGYVGGILSLLVVSSQAASAGSSEEAADIMKRWAVEAVGGEIGSIIGGAAAGIALAAVGVASAPVVATLVVGASLVGGFVGAEWSSEFYDALGEQDGPDRARVLGKLTELYFGPGAVVAPDQIPSADGSFSWIDPSLSAQEIYQAAQGDIAWRYALDKLNPFVVGGVDYAAVHNAEGELDLYDSSTGQGLTDQYLMARAEALHTYVALFNDGIDGVGRTFPAGYAPHFYDSSVQSEDASEEAVVDLDAGSDSVAQRLFGNERGEIVRGGYQDDMLFGDDGQDHLDGGEGADYLEGGKGIDTYIVTDGDSLFDRDGSGRVLFDDVILSGGSRIGQGSIYASADGRLRYEMNGDDLQVTRVQDGASVSILGHRNGELGIELGESQAGVSANHLLTQGGSESEVLRGQIDIAVVDLELLNAWNLPDRILGEGGRDWIYAWDDGPQHIENGMVFDSAPDTDIVEGGPGKDFIHGGAGDDVLYATDSVDASSVILGQGSLEPFVSGPQEGDFVSGQSGQDELYGSGRLDGLFGGDGDDLIYGGAGDDVIDGDRSVVVTPAAMDPVSHDYTWHEIDQDGVRQLYLFDYVGGVGDDRIHAGEGDDLVWGGAADDRIYGDAGHDQIQGDLAGVHPTTGQALLAGALHGNDLLSGGTGDDVIDGNNGHDILLGGAGADQLDGDSRVLVEGDAPLHGDDYLSGGAGHDTLTGGGGADLLLGGSGEDLLYGDLNGLDPAWHGADVLYGGDGEDQLVGDGGGDTLHGGSGDDSLYGDDIDQFLLAGDDALYGGSGSDELSGGRGRDLLFGGTGTDRLWGDAGDDRLVGGAGADYLEGGAGADTYWFAAGDSPYANGQTEVIVDAAAQKNSVVFAADVARESVELVLIRDSDDVILRYADSDALYITGGLTGAIAQFAFDDVGTLGYRELVAAEIDNARYLSGGAGDDLTFGSGADDNLSGMAGNDLLLGGAGADRIDGGTGANRLVGGAGSDTYLVNANAQANGHIGAQNQIIDSPDRSSLVRFGAGIEVTDLSLEPSGSGVLISSLFNNLFIPDGANGKVVDRFEFDSGEVYDFYGLSAAVNAPEIDVQGSAAADDLQGSSGRDNLRGLAGDDRLFGGAGRDRLDGGLGADQLSGGTGYDHYIVHDPGDLVIEAENAGYDWVESSVDYTLPEHVEALQLEGAAPLAATGNSAANYIRGNSAANQLSGGAGDDHILGYGGLDVIDGGDGDDYLQGSFRISGGNGDDRMFAYTRSSDGSRPIYELAGGSGNDTYELWQPYFIYELGTIVEQADGGVDTLVLHGDRFSIGSGLPDHVENLRYEYATDQWFGADTLNLRGNALDNRIEIGRENPDSRIGLHGLAGDDTLIGSSGSESGSSSQGLFGGEGDDQLMGLAGNDDLFGGAGDDVLTGGSGGDRLLGGQGVDTYVFARGDSSDADRPDRIEDDEGASVLRFGPGIGVRDLQIEQVGSDLHVTYSHDDTLIFDGGAAPGRVAHYAFDSGAQLAPEVLDSLMADNRVPIVTAGPLSWTVHEGRPLELDLPAELFFDPDGDSLQYSLESATPGPVPEWVQFDASQRTVSIGAVDGDAGAYRLSISATDPSGARADVGVDLQVLDTGFAVGGSANDVLRGSAGADNLAGGEGQDRLYGGAGIDWLDGDVGDDRLYGGAGDDLLSGSSGRDLLNGQAGADQMSGGPGNDRYFVDNLADSLIEQADEGSDRVYSDIDFTLAADFEDLVLRGNLDLTGTGNMSANRLYGNSGANLLYGLGGNDRLLGRDGDDLLFGGEGNDVLNGGTGSDELSGGLGDDRYYVDVASDHVIEGPEAGLDRVYSTTDFGLTADLEYLFLQGDLDLAGVGNADANRLYGNTGDNLLRGQAGDDRLIGRDGGDRLFGDEGGDRLYGGNGDDLLSGGAGNDLLDGGAGSDTYRFDLGDGSDRIHNKVDGAVPEDHDMLRFAEGIDAEAIWFSQAGNDLLARVIGSQDRVRMSGWYADPETRLDSIVDGDGDHITADRVEQLISAVAGFGVGSSATVDLTPPEQEAYAAIVSAHWQAASPLQV